jgi:hypothetical protein
LKRAKSLVVDANMLLLRQKDQEQALRKSAQHDGIAFSAHGIVSGIQESYT